MEQHSLKWLSKTPSSEITTKKDALASFFGGFIGSYGVNSQCFEFRSF